MAKLLILFLACQINILGPDHFTYSPVSYSHFLFLLYVCGCVCSVRLRIKDSVLHNASTLIKSQIFIMLWTLRDHWLRKNILCCKVAPYSCRGGHKIGPERLVYWFSVMLFCCIHKQLCLSLRCMNVCGCFWSGILGQTILVSFL